MLNEDIVFFIGHINYIGGVETYIYYIKEMYGADRNITLVYKWGAPKQLARLIDKIKCVRYDNQKIKCNVFMFCYDMSIINEVEAKDYALTIHADYKQQNIRVTIPPQTTKIYAVSNLARDSFIETHKDQLDKLGLTIETLYNPIPTEEIRKSKKALFLVSATRLTKEKGGERIKAMAKRLKEKNIPFIWFVFTTDNIKSDIEGLYYVKPDLNILPYVKKASYLVQLSDTEGYAYSLVESLCLGTPLIVTELPILEEMRVKEGLNAFILKFDLSNLDNVIDNAYNNDLKGFDYIPKESIKEWNKVLGESKGNKYSKQKQIWVKTLFEYTDTTLNKKLDVGTIYKVSRERAKYLLDNSAVELSDGGQNEV